MPIPKCQETLSTLGLPLRMRLVCPKVSPTSGTFILVPRGRAPFGQHQESRPLAKSNTGSPRFTDFPLLCACSESSLTNLVGSGLNLLCLLSHSKTECRWTRPEVAILGADRKEHGLWGREWGTFSLRSNACKRIASLPEVCRTSLGRFQSARKLLELWASTFAWAWSNLKWPKGRGTFSFAIKRFQTNRQLAQRLQN